MQQAGRSRVRFPMRSLHCSIDLILQPHYGPPVDSASNRNEYQESFCGGKGRSARKAETSPPSVSLLSKNVGASTSHNPMGLHGVLQG
jgi:hypothetical protein